MLQEQQADDDAQDTQHTWGPRCEKAVDRRHHNFSHERPETLPNPSGCVDSRVMNKRPHQGRWFGKTPMQTLLAAMPMTKEKMIAA